MVEKAVVDAGTALETVTVHCCFGDAGLGAVVMQAVYFLEEVLTLDLEEVLVEAVEASLAESGVEVGFG